jgi:hypothetical protein
LRFNSSEGWLKIKKNDKRALTPKGYVKQNKLRGVLDSKGVVTQQSIEIPVFDNFGVTKLQYVRAYVSRKELFV